MDKITVRQIIDLIDRNHEGTEWVLFSEDGGENWNEISTGSVALGLMGNYRVDSMDAEDSRIRLWLSEDDVNGYWATRGLKKPQDDEGKEA